MSDFTVRKVRFQNGERISLVLRPDGLPVHEVVLFLDRYRRRGRAANTLNGICSGCEVQEGIARNEVTQYLWSEVALRTFERIGIQRGQLEVYSKVHITAPDHLERLQTVPTIRSPSCQIQRSRDLP